MFEVRRRAAGFPNKEPEAITGSESVARIFQDMLEENQAEEFHVMYLNRANKPMSVERVSHGGITGTVADPRIILRRALALKGCCGMILCHNHPSGNLKPSRADEELTYKIRECSRFFDLKLLDHVIVSREGYFSFADQGMI